MSVADILQSDDHAFGHYLIYPSFFFVASLECLRKIHLSVFAWHIFASLCGNLLFASFGDRRHLARVCVLMRIHLVGVLQRSEHRTLLLNEMPASLITLTHMFGTDAGPQRLVVHARHRSSVFVCLCVCVLRGSVWVWFFWPSAQQKPLAHVNSFVINFPQV